MRPHSRYQANPEAPRAKGVCDRCGQTWQHAMLKWQFEWIGPRLQNLRFLVCPPCNDKPQPNKRTIVIPPDPLPIKNARPENYVADDNGTIQVSTGLTGLSSLAQPSGGLSVIGADANFSAPQYGSRIGNLTLGGGINAGFDGIINKPSWMSAAGGISNSSYNNYIGINWQGNVAGLAMPSSLLPPVLTHTILGVKLYAPSDRSFLGFVATPYVVQASPTGTAVFGAWTTVASGNTAGTAGESITITSTAISPNPLNQFHRVAFQGNGTDYVSVAQVQFSVAETGGNQ